MVLYTWALLVDFLSEHWFIITATSMEIFIRAFMVCDMKAHDTKRAPKLSCHKAESKIFGTATNLLSRHAKFNVDFENNWLFRKTSVRDEKLRF